MRIFGGFIIDGLKVYGEVRGEELHLDRKSTRLNSSH